MLFIPEAHMLPSQIIDPPSPHKAMTSFVDDLCVFVQERGEGFRHFFV